MCKISNEIKLCTCTEKDYYALENSWAIFRRKKGWLKVGQTVYNEQALDISATEIQFIEQKLNTKNMFDFDYFPEEEDKLRIKLTYQNKCSEYDFKYSNSNWEIYNEHPLDWMNDLTVDKPLYFEESYGKIEKPFK